MYAAARKSCCGRRGRARTRRSTSWPRSSPRAARAMAEGGAALHGVGVSAGVAVGPAVRVVDAVPEPPVGSPVAGAEEETAAALAALEAVAADLEARGAVAGGEAEQVLGAQALMARDP